MELCKQSLKQYVQTEQLLNDGLSEAKVKKIMRDVILGLQELHSKKIVHLDIKPDNILQSQSGNFKLGDLGLARLENNIIKEKNIPEGDCRYIAMELFNEDPNQEVPDLKKSDIFSLGMTIFEIIEQREIDKQSDEWGLIRQGLITFSPRTHQKYS